MLALPKEASISGPVKTFKWMHTAAHQLNKKALLHCTDAFTMIATIFRSLRAPRKRPKTVALVKIEKMPYLKQLSEVVRPVLSIIPKDLALFSYLQFCLTFLQDISDWKDKRFQKFWGKKYSRLTRKKIPGKISAWLT